MNDEVRIPDVEVIVGAAGSDVAVFCFYKRSDIHDGYDIVSAITGTDSRAALRTVLQDCIQALAATNWHHVDELREDATEKEDEPPF